MGFGDPPKKSWPEVFGSEGAFWALAVVCIAIICVVIALTAKGCSTETSVTCSDGTTYSAKGGPWQSDESEISLDQAVNFCKHHGGVSG